MRLSIGLVVFATIAWCLASFCSAVADESYRPPRVELTPLPQARLSWKIDGVEKLKWHFGDDAPRPFFYPLRGPSGVSLTRMGHPGAANHDHHRSVWLAHHDVAGVNFWSDQTDARVRQKHWYAYRDGDDEAIMATALGWYDGNGRELMTQDLAAALRPLPNGEYELELQCTFRPGGKQPEVRLGKTNFGFLAVRVAKSLSVHFGGGTITNSEGQRGEAELFGQTARWMDYSGPVAVGEGSNRRTVTEGITYFDHPDNPRYPTRWHVREDGWMGASLCREDGYTIRTEEPLVLRYLLHVHGGPYDREAAERTHSRFSQRSGFVIEKTERPHRQFEVRRK